MCLAFFLYIVDSLEKAGYRVAAGGSIKIGKRNASGRVERININGTSIPGTKFREIMGYGNIKSTMFNIAVTGAEVKFSGGGSGHGVGMCQWGAKGMAEEGTDYRKILGYYYRGTNIKILY